MITHQITTFKFHGFAIRCVMIDGTPWFTVADICKLLDINNAHSSLNNFGKTEIIQLKVDNGPGRPNQLVSEGSMFRLIARSNKPEANEFQSWLYNEVLPAIRRDGAYFEGEERLAIGEMSEDEFLAKAVEVAARKLNNERQRRVKAEKLCDIEAARANKAEGALAHHSRLTLKEFAQERIKAKLREYQNRKFRTLCKALCAEQGIDLERREGVIVYTKEGRQESNPFVFDRHILDAAWAELGLNQSHAQPPKAPKAA